MRIAEVAPLLETVPPAGYGGTERVVATLCDALVEAGHNVTLFAADGSKTKARLNPMRSCALRIDNIFRRHDLAAHINMLAGVRDTAEDFDIIHFHTDLLHIPMFEGCMTPVVTTLHTQLNENDAFGTYLRWSSHPLIALSDSHKRAMPNGNWAGTIYNGLSISQFSPSYAQGDYLAFLGRFSPDKGAHVAIAIAKALGRPLYLAARIDAQTLTYFDKEIRPHLSDPLIHYIGEIGDDAKGAFLSQAAALLFPVTWPEPFGLVMIEAMACGTPIIAFRSGAVPEIITDRANGYVVHSQAEMINAVQRLDDINRKEVRQIFERRFSASVMADSYVAAFEQIITLNRNRL